MGRVPFLLAGAPLGNKVRTDSTLQPQRLQRFTSLDDLHFHVDKKTGEVSYYQVVNRKKKGKKQFEEIERPHKTHKQLRAERYRLKSVVNKIFPESSTAKCCRAVIPNQKVKILKSPQNKAHYAGLRRCSSVWLCPVCAAKIAERRRAELVAAIAKAKVMGLRVFLMTPTIPHGMGDDVGDILDKMMKAWRKVTTSRAGRKVHDELYVEGTIRSLETTDGKNGFHPHFHVVVFAKPTFADVRDFQDAYLPLWQDACVKAGLPRPSNEHGLKVDDGSKAARYASKWGLEDEMTKGHTKTSKGDKGMTPWDMLRDVLETGSERSRSRFYIYANAFKGRRQLYWSNGLKAKLAVDDFTDEQLAMMQEERAVEVAELTEKEWKAVVWARCEASLLDIAEDNPETIQDFLRALRRNYLDERRQRRRKNFETKEAVR